MRYAKVTNEVVETDRWQHAFAWLPHKCCIRDEWFWLSMNYKITTLCTTKAGITTQSIRWPSS